MADETQTAEPVAAPIAPEVPVVEPVKKTKEPKLEKNQTKLLSGNVYTAN